MTEPADLTPPCTIAPPRVEEADALGLLHTRIWQQAYAGLLAQHHLDAIDPAARAARWRGIAERADADGWDQGKAGGVRSLIARVDGVPVGMITTGTPRDEHPAAPVELWQLNVDAAWHGRGVARALVDAALPDGPAYLWVLRGNERAIAFYRKLGFELDGADLYDPRYECYDERMVRG